MYSPRRRVIDELRFLWFLDVGVLPAVPIDFYMKLNLSVSQLSKIIQNQFQKDIFMFAQKMFIMYAAVVLYF